MEWIKNREDIPHLNSFMSSKWKYFIIKKTVMKEKRAFSFVLQDLYINVCVTYLALLQTLAPSDFWI